ncbi:hypothetical protein B7463_g816, partial [Scytalidium lignicola]
MATAAYYNSMAVIADDQVPWANLSSNNRVRQNQANAFFKFIDCNAHLADYLGSFLITLNGAYSDFPLDQMAATLQYHVRVSTTRLDAFENKIQPNESNMRILAAQWREAIEKTNWAANSLASLVREVPADPAHPKQPLN